MSVEIIQGDCLTELAKLDDKSIHCCVTSPPYWGLRDYGTARWEGGVDGCDHIEEKCLSSDKNTLGGGRGDKTRQTISMQFKNKCRKCGAWRIDDQLGLEPTPEEYAANMVSVFREVRRVLRDNGTLWLNLGDSYASQPSGNKDPSGFQQKSKAAQSGALAQFNVNRAKDRSNKKWSHSRAFAVSGIKAKDLVGIPWMVAFALRADGWYLRSDIIWNKPNPMPESVTDRPTKSHEYIFLMSKSQTYYYDADSIAERLCDSSMERLSQPNITTQDGSSRVPDKTNGNMKAVAKKKFDRSMAGGGTNIDGHTGDCKPDGSPFEYMLTGKRNKRSVWTVTTKPYKEAHFATFPPDLIRPCILAGCPQGGTVLDTFGGSGTVGEVAEMEGRNSILIELNTEYINLIKKRTAQMGLFAS